MGLDAIESARPDGAERGTGVVCPTDTQRRGMVMAKKSAAQKSETNTDELEGMAWVELAEEHVRCSGDARLALSLIYLRDAVRGGVFSPALNLAEALNSLTEESCTALAMILERNAEHSAVQEWASLSDGTRRARLLASGWRWLSKIATTQPHS